MVDEGFKRKLVAILSADVEGYSRLMDDEEATIRTLPSYRTAIVDLVQQFCGRVVDTPGDNILTDFSIVVAAISCPLEVQEELQVTNVDLPDRHGMEFRMGNSLEDVVEERCRI